MTSGLERDSQTVQQVVGRLLCHPLRFFGTQWNWKTAVWSGLTRAPIFVIVAASHGAIAATKAGGLEFVFRFITSGYSGALVQSLRDARPHWLALAVLMGVLPLLFLGLEALLHWAIGTPNLEKGMVASTALTALATLFNFYAMRRGAFLASGEGASFSHDVRRIPSLIGGFLLWTFRWIGSYRR